MAFFGGDGTGLRQGTLDAMGMMTDPFMADHGDAVSSPSGAPGFAEENGSAGAYGSSDKSLSKRERDAYGMLTTLNNNNNNNNNQLVTFFSTSTARSPPV